MAALAVMSATRLPDPTKDPFHRLPLPPISTWYDPFSLHRMETEESFVVTLLAEIIGETTKVGATVSLTMATVAEPMFPPEFLTQAYTGLLHSEKLDESMVTPVEALAT
jgi:hypothetical protein